jgi:hypothetical protein
MNRLDWFGGRARKGVQQTPEALLIAATTSLRSYVPPGLMPADASQS